MSHGSILTSVRILDLRFAPFLVVQNVPHLLADLTSQIRAEQVPTVLRD